MDFRDAILDGLGVRQVFRTNGSAIQRDVEGKTRVAAAWCELSGEGRVTYYNYKELEADDPRIGEPAFDEYITAEALKVQDKETAETAHGVLLDFLSGVAMDS